MAERGRAGADRTPVTVIGLGAMGTALTGAFLDAGHPTTVWNRSAGKAGDLVARGATGAATLTEAVTASPLVVVCVLDDEVVHELLDPLGDTLAGRVLVNLTNGTPEQARRTAAWAEGRGAGYLDGGIMATPPLIGQPEALVLYSGARTAFERHQGTLDVLGASTYLGADAGLASLHDLAMLSAMYGMVAGAGHAFALVGSEQADLGEFTSSLLIPWLNAMVAAAVPAQAQEAAGQHASEDSPAGMQAVAIANIVDASRAQGVDDDLLAHLLAPLRELVGERGAGRDLPGLVELVRKPGAAA